MAKSARDKTSERERYDRRAAQTLARGAWGELGPVGAAGIPVELRAPYLAYESHIRSVARSGVCVLDLCCGNGQHSLTAAAAGADVTVADIAPHNVELTLARARFAGFTLRGVIADTEQLPFANASFDVVTMAGSLSYVEPARFLSELRRVLRPGGTFVFVDSLNHNPVYRFNRWLHYCRGERSRSTLERMPTLATLERIRRDFPDLCVSYHGIAAFLAPLLRLAGSERAARGLDSIDRALPFACRFAFKVVGRGQLAPVFGR
jgi:SAM-dependent methyltransferase